MPKSAALPQIRVDSQLRRSVEAALVGEETLSGFVETAVRRALELRHVQAEFAARGQAASEHFARTGHSHTTEAVLDELRQMTQRRRAQLEPKTAS